MSQFRRAKLMVELATKKVQLENVVITTTLDHSTFTENSNDNLDHVSVIYTSSDHLSNDVNLPTAHQEGQVYCQSINSEMEQSEIICNESLSVSENPVFQQTVIEESDSPGFESEDSYRPPDSSSSSDNENDQSNIIGNHTSTYLNASTSDEPRVKRRRVADPYSWKRNIRHRNRIQGESYVNTKGVIVEKKQPKYINCEKCRFKCSKDISEEKQLSLCKEYYALADYTRQKSMICSLVQEENIQRHRKRGEQSLKPKSKSRLYYLFNNNGDKQRVCLKFFCATFCVSFRAIDVALKQKGKETGCFVGKDNRKGKIAPNAISESTIQKVKDHIDSFPRVESHYCRRDSNIQYLSSDLNIAVMYRLYQEKCTEDNTSPVKESFYRSLFNKYDPKLSFFKPKKDQCTKCNIYKDAADKGAIENEYILHKKREKEAFIMKENDKLKAKAVNGTTFRAITFDLQAILTLPFAGDSQIYYKRKLSVHNFTIFDAYNSDGYCYIWDETHGGKGSAEIGSCILKYLYSLPLSVTHVSTFSDTCGGQNRNKYVAAAMLYAVNSITNINIIDLKFMESGHSYLEADSMHSTIERARKHKKVFTTQEWALLISMARRNPRPYNVDILTYRDVYNLQEIADLMLLNVKINNNNETVNWLNIKWLRFTKDDPYRILYKYELTEDAEFMCIDILKNRRAGRTRNWNAIAINKKYDSCMPISSAKYKDLLNLISTGVITETYKKFYEDLPHQ